MPDRSARRDRLRSGWTPPGPRAAGDLGQAPADDETLDALTGDWRLFQRLRGHRYSADDLLVAWFAGERARRLGRPVRRILDLGSGIGSVALMMAWQFPEATLTTLEAQPESAALARKSAIYNGILDRIDIRVGDLRSEVPQSGDFDLVTGSPPYFGPAEGRISEAPQRGPCRFELRGGVEDYLVAAAPALAPGGLLALVMLAAAGPRVAAAAVGIGLSMACVRPVVFREGRPPHIALFAFATASGAGAVAETPLILRCADGRRTSEFREIRLAMGFPPGAA